MAPGRTGTEGRSPCHCEAQESQVTVGPQLSPGIKPTHHTAGLVAVAASLGPVTHVTHGVDQRTSAAASMAWPA